MDNRKYIHELFTVVGTDSILIIDRSRRLRRLHCPFRAIVVFPVGIFGKGEVVLVEAVKMTENLRDVFVVGGKAYYLVYFQLLIDQ